MLEVPRASRSDICVCAWHVANGRRKGSGISGCRDKAYSFGGVTTVFDIFKSSEKFHKRFLFWVYIEGGGRSFNLKVASADNIGENTGCTYINWDAGIVRLYDGAACQLIGDFETDTWKYVRIVADVGKSEFDFSSGDDRNDALAAKPEKDLAFRNAALGPVAKWVVFYTWGITAPGYVDDLLVYEGADALDLAVDPSEKLTTFWGQVKQGL